MIFNLTGARWRSPALLFLLAISGASTAAPPDAPVAFNAHELTLGGSHCAVTAISNGIAVGAALIPGDAEQHAFAWTEDRGMIDLGTLGGTRAGATAVEGLQIVGYSSTAGDAELHAFIWTPKDGMRDLGTLGGTYGRASSISGGVVVGESTTATGDIHAFRWTRQTGMVDLGTLVGGTESSAVRIHHGLTAGWSTARGNQIRTRRPVVWDRQGQLFDIGGTPLDIDPLEGWVRNAGQTTDVHRGAVVGHFQATPAPDLFNHAFVWTVPHGFFDLGVPPGFQESFALATNGQLIVGVLSAPTVQHPFVWSRADGFLDLGTVHGESRAMAVNHAGWVIGYFVRPEGGAGTFLWTRRTGMRDVTPAIFSASAFGAFPVGIDDKGRIAVVDDPRGDVVRSAVLVPQKH
jgi:probable HAF family extracellular repeat protein